MSEAMTGAGATANAPMPGMALAEMIKIDETRIRGHLGKVVAYFRAAMLDRRPVTVVVTAPGTA